MHPILGRVPFSNRINFSTIMIITRSNVLDREPEHMHAPNKSEFSDTYIHSSNNSNTNRSSRLQKHKTAARKAEKAILIRRLRRSLRRPQTTPSIKV